MRGGKKPNSRRGWTRHGGRGRAALENDSVGEREWDCRQRAIIVNGRTETHMHAGGARPQRASSRPPPVGQRPQLVLNTHTTESKRTLTVESGLDQRIKRACVPVKGLVNVGDQGREGENDRDELASQSPSPNPPRPPFPPQHRVSTADKDRERDGIPVCPLDREREKKRLQDSERKPSEVTRDVTSARRVRVQQGGGKLAVEDIYKR